MSGTSLDIKELTDNGLSETAGLISRREYNLSLVRSRQTAELIVKTYASEKGLEYSGLADTIEKLYSSGIINMSSRNALHNIRIFGNKAVHEADNDPKDAQKAYYLLKTEIQTFMSRKTVNVNRTPVRIDFNRGSTGGSSGISDRGVSDAAEVPIRDKDTRIDRADTEHDPAGLRSGRGHQGSFSSGDIRLSGADVRRDTQSNTASGRNRDNSTRRIEGNGRPQAGNGSRQTGSGTRRTGNGSRQTGSGARSGSRSSRPAGKKGSKSSGANTALYYDIIKIAAPILAVLLIVLIIRGLNIFPSKNKTTTAAVQTSAAAETTVALETLAPKITVPETKPPVYEYRIKGSGVNVRYADNQNRIYTQLSNGTAIGTVTEIEGSDFVQFTLDGVNVVVNKNYIEPVS